MSGTPEVDPLEECPACNSPGLERRGEDILQCSNADCRVTTFVPEGGSS